MGIVYCKKCGQQTIEFLPGKDSRKCNVCGFTFVEAPEEITLERWLNEDGKQAIEEIVKASPEFDPYYFEHRDEIIAKESAEFERKMAIGRAIQEGARPDVALKTNGQVPHCPICGSANLSKISAVKKAAKVGFFGLFGAGDLGKTWKCNNCGSKF